MTWSAFLKDHLGYSVEEVFWVEHSHAFGAAQARENGEQ